MNPSKKINNNRKVKYKLWKTIKRRRKTHHFWLTNDDCKRNVVTVFRCVDLVDNQSHSHNNITTETLTVLQKYLPSVGTDRIMVVEIWHVGGLSRHRQRCVPRFANENIFLLRVTWIIHDWRQTGWHQSRAKTVRREWRVTDWLQSRTKTIRHEWAWRHRYFKKTI